MFVYGNIHAKYYQIHLNYGYHQVSHPSMLGVATMPAKQ